MLRLIFIVALISKAALCNPPEWPSGYSVSGYLMLPFAEIREKFVAYYDADSGNSRIDYYDGMDKTFQLSKKGQFGNIM